MAKIKINVQCQVSKEVEFETVQQLEKFLENAVADIYVNKEDWGGNFNFSCDKQQREDFIKAEKTRKYFMIQCDSPIWTDNMNRDRSMEFGSKNLTSNLTKIAIILDELDKTNLFYDFFIREEYEGNDAIDVNIISNNHKNFMTKKVNDVTKEEVIKKLLGSDDYKQNVEEILSMWLGDKGRLDSWIEWFKIHDDIVQIERVK